MLEVEPGEPRAPFNGDEAVDVLVHFDWLVILAGGVLEGEGGRFGRSLRLDVEASEGVVGELVDVLAGDEELGVLHVLELVAPDEAIAHLRLHLLIAVELEAQLS